MLRLVNSSKVLKTLKKQLVVLEQPAATTYTTRTFISTTQKSNVSTKQFTPLIKSSSSTSTIVFNEILRNNVRNYSSKAKEINFPALSPSMTEGNIVQWKKKEGEYIKAGDVIAEVETDKATMDFQYEDSNGYLAKILVPEGTKGIEINKPIAIIVSKKEDIEAAVKNYQSGSSKASTPSTPAPAAETPKASTPSAPKSTKTYPKHKLVGMPALSPSMETGGIASWSKKEGDQIKAGDAIAQVETDKATMDFQYEDGNGFLAKILVPAGTTGVQINQPVCIIVSKKEDCDKFADFSLEEQSSTPAAQESTSTSTSSSTPSTQQQTTTTRQSGERIFATPAAKFEASSKGYDLSLINGTGPNNRIVKADVLEFTPQKQQQQQAAPAESTTTTTKKSTVSVSDKGEFTDFPHSNIRKVTAARLTESKQTVPHYYLTMECRVDKLLKIRSELNAMNTVKLSVNDFIIKASAAALRDNPVVNSTWTDSYIRRYSNIDINVAVNTPQGLFTPIVRGADAKGLNAISTSVKQLAEKAQNNKLHPSEFESGTFTISNLGMLGIKSFAAVINPPQAAILAVGTTETRVVPSTIKGSDSPYETATILSVTLSCDHRVVDGAVGAEWLKSFKDYVENPIKLIL